MLQLKIEVALGELREFLFRIHKLLVQAAALAARANEQNVLACLKPKLMPSYFLIFFFLLLPFNGFF